MRKVLSLMLIPLLLQGTTACDDAEDTGHHCGPGTHWDGSACMPDEDADTDADADADSDVDTDTDADDTGPTDADDDGWTIADGDCDDTNPAVHPGAEEVVGDGVDQNCDHAEVCYADGDGDGYGASTTTVSMDLDCDDTGESTVSTDCDDVDPYINPGAAEVCEDGIDQDCNGLDLRCWGDLHLSDADAVLMGTDGEGAGSAVAAADLDDDDLADILVGARYNSEGGGTWPGAVYLVSGPVSGLVSLSSADAKMIGEGAYGGGAGSALAVSDMDGDGAQDILIGAVYSSDSRGGVIVVLGPVSGTIGLSEAEALLLGEASDDYAGTAVTAADVDDDGIQDVIVGARRNATGGRFTGAAYLVLGPISGERSLSMADAKFIGEDSADHAGCAVAAGDVNDDGIHDVLVGADWHYGGAGAVYVIHGPSTGTLDLSEADAKLLGEAADFSGGSLALDDVDADGSQDVLVGGALRNGFSYLVLGPIMDSLELSDADAKFVSEFTTSTSANSVRVDTGDMDGDGTVDILIGAGEADAGAGTQSGVVSLVLGPVSGTVDLSFADATITGESEGDQVGKSVASGDTNGDGSDDIIIGSDWGDSGAVFLFLGGGS